MMKNMYLFVVFLVVISSASSSLSVDDQDIFMVVDDPTSMHHPGMETSKLEIGKFVLEDGKVLTLSRKSSPSRNCVGNFEDQCGALDWCCSGLTCDGVAWGKCHLTPGCYEKGKGCSPLSILDPPCCYPYSCKTIYGETWGYCE